MIVRSVETGWIVIFQTTHGLLAQRIATQLQEARALPFWFETQVAIGLHDDLHRTFQVGQHEYLTEAGAPKDFTLVAMKDGQRTSQMRDRIDEAFRKHTWIGILQSMHADCLYRSEDTTADMQAILDKEATRRNIALDRLGIKPSVVQQTYDWMHFCDRLSLILSGDDIPAMHRRLEIITNTAGTRFDVWRDATETVRIAPWPFVDESVELSIECRTLSALSYTDDAELGTALQQCDVEVRTFHLSHGSIDDRDGQ